MQIQLLCLHVVVADDELSFCHKTRVDFAQFRSFGFKLHIEPLEEQQHHCWWFLGDNSPRFICSVAAAFFWSLLHWASSCLCQNPKFWVLLLHWAWWMCSLPWAASNVPTSSSSSVFGELMQSPHFSTGFDGLLSNSIINWWSFNQWSTVWEATSLSSKFLEEEFEQSTLKSG